MIKDCEFTPTNTLASIPLDILTVEGVEDPMINVNKLATLDLEESYFELAVKFINEQNTALANEKAVLYRSLSEATSTGVVLESFSDFFSSVTDIINKFIKFIKSLIDKFITALHRLVSSDKYIKKHKKDFNSFREVDNFDFNGYKYSFSPAIPTANAHVAFNQDLFEDLFSSFSTSGDITADDIRNYNGSRADITDKYDAFRASVIGQSNGSIDESEFSSELFKVYRSDEIDTEDIEITSSEVHQSLNRFLNYDKTKKQVESDQRRIEKDYDSIKKQVKEITSSSNSGAASQFLSWAGDRLKTAGGTNQGVPLSGEMLTQIDIYTKAKIDEVTEYSNIHTLAFSAKLDALKECYKQDRTILYTALAKIQRTDNKREVI